MPIFLENFEWFQTEESIKIKLFCPIVFLAKNVTLLHAENYLKLSHQPYIFEIFFEANVKVDETRCLFREQTVNFEFFKREKTLWNDIQLFNKELR